MALALNASNFNVDGQGKVTFTGLASGINAQQAVDSIMKARSVKVDSLNARVDTNTSKVKALDEFKAKVKALNASVANLYGKMTADSSFDAFARKIVTSSARRVSDGSVVASSASDLATISADNRAAAGTHTVEILQTARGERSDPRPFRMRPWLLVCQGALSWAPRRNWPATRRMRSPGSRGARTRSVLPLDPVPPPGHSAKALPMPLRSKRRSTSRQPPAEAASSSR